MDELLACELAAGDGVKVRDDVVAQVQETISELAFFVEQVCLVLDGLQAGEGFAVVVVVIAIAANVLPAGKYGRFLGRGARAGLVGFGSPRLRAVALVGRPSLGGISPRTRLVRSGSPRLRAIALVGRPSLGGIGPRVWLIGVTRRPISRAAGVFLPISLAASAIRIAALVGACSAILIGAIAARDAALAFVRTVRSIALGAVALVCACVIRSVAVSGVAAARTRARSFALLGALTCIHATRGVVLLCVWAARSTVLPSADRGVI